MKTTLSLLLAFLCLLAPAFAQDAPPMAPRIVCDEPVYDFGTAENSGTIEHHYVVRNDGNLTLEIQSVRATCGCTAVSPEKNIVAPGEETKITARFDLRGRTGMQIKTIFVQSNDPQTPTLNLQLRGTATQALRAQPATLFFGRVDPNASRTRTFQLVSERGVITVQSAECDNPGIRVELQPLDDGQDGSTRQFNVTLDDSLSGAINTSVNLAVQVAGEIRHVSVPVAASVIPPPAP